MRASALLPSRDPQKRLRAEAAEWVVRIADDPALEDDPAFRRWLEGGADRARAYSNAQRAWQIAARVGGRVPDATPFPATRLTRRFPLPSFGRLVAASTVSGLAILGALWTDMVRPDLRQNLLADHVVRPGPAQDVALPDGTRMLLDGGSALDYAEDAATRRVTIRSGAAYFAVSRDGRPFSVRMDGTEVRVLGTRFEMRDCGGCILVTLEEGSIEVRDPHAQGPTVLEPGQQMRIEAGEPPVITQVDISQALIGREGRYTFYDTTLREVTGVLQRRGAGTILFATEALATRPITGSINLDDPLSELAALADALGLRLMPLPGGYFVM